MKRGVGEEGLDVLIDRLVNGDYVISRGKRLMGLEQLTDINLALIGIAFFVAGCVKGVLGFGTPLIVIPVTALFDVVTALVIVAIPTLIPNLWQM